MAGRVDLPKCLAAVRGAVVLPAALIATIAVLPARAANNTVRVDIAVELPSDGDHNGVAEMCDGSAPQDCEGPAPKSPLNNKSIHNKVPATDFRTKLCLGDTLDAQCDARVTHGSGLSYAFEEYTSAREVLAFSQRIFAGEVAGKGRQYTPDTKIIAVDVPAIAGFFVGSGKYIAVPPLNGSDFVCLPAGQANCTPTLEISMLPCSDPTTACVLASAQDPERNAQLNRYAEADALIALSESLFVEEQSDTQPANRPAIPHDPGRLGQDRRQ